MKIIFLLFVSFLTSLAKLLGPGGTKTLLAENLLLKQQLLMLTRSRQRAPNFSGELPPFHRRNPAEAGEDGDAGLMLELKQGGLGWGQIKKIPDLVDYGMGYQEDIEWLQADKDWEGEGPPPWAAGGKDKVKNGNGNGPPAWSNAGGNDKFEEDNEGE